MQLIIYYLIFMVACDLAAYLIGLITEREFGSYASLIVFLTLYFLGFGLLGCLRYASQNRKHPRRAASRRKKTWRGTIPSSAEGSRRTAPRRKPTQRTVHAASPGCRPGLETRRLTLDVTARGRAEP